MAFRSGDLPIRYALYAHVELARRLRMVAFCNTDYQAEARNTRSVEIIKPNTGAIVANSISRNATISDANELTSSSPNMPLDQIADNDFFMDIDDLNDLGPMGQGAYQRGLRAQARVLAEQIDTNLMDYLLGGPTIASNEGTVTTANIRVNASNVISKGSSTRYIGRSDGAETGQSTNDSLTIETLDDIIDRATIAGFLGGSSIPEARFSILLPNTLLPTYRKAVRDEKLSEAYNERLFETPGANPEGVVGMYGGGQVRVYRPIHQYTVSGKTQHAIFAGRPELITFAMAYDALIAESGLVTINVGGSATVKAGTRTYARTRHGRLTEEQDYGYVGFVRAEA